MYSVKLKLELNILSRLVDLVHGSGSRDRSMTLEPFDSSTITGMAHAKVRREMEPPKGLGDSWSSTADKTSVDHHNNGEVSLHKQSFASGSADESNAITHPLSYASIVRERTRNDSDIDYGEILRSISRS